MSKSIFFHLSHQNIFEKSSSLNPHTRQLSQLGLNSGKSLARKTAGRVPPPTTRTAHHPHRPTDPRVNGVHGVVCVSCIVCLSVPARDCLPNGEYASFCLKLRDGSVEWGAENSETQLLAVR